MRIIKTNSHEEYKKILEKIKSKKNSFLGDYTGVKDCWKDEPCVIVGCGKSIRGFDLNQLDGIHSIGINHIIEDYDGFEVLFFLDDCFIDRTNYNLNNFKGKIFYSNKCRKLNNAIMFNTNENKPTEYIEDGLYTWRMSGIAALNLAIIMGAYPIYLLGFDCGGDDASDYHYKKDYAEVERTYEKMSKYIRNAEYFEQFKQWSDKIINCSMISNIKTFVKSEYPDFSKLKYKRNKRINKNKELNISHISNLGELNKCGEITRGIYNNSIGKHFFNKIDNNIDVYINDVLFDTERKMYYGQKARERSNKYTLDKMVIEYNKLIKSLL